MATRTRLTIDLTPEQRRRIRQAAAARDMTVSQFVSAAVEEKLDEADAAEATESEEARQERIARGLEAIRRVDELRKALPPPRPGQLSAVDLLREEREKRTQHLLDVLDEHRRTASS